MKGSYDEFLAGVEDCIKVSSLILKPQSLSMWVVGLVRDKKGNILPLHHDITRIHLNNGYTLKEEVIIYWDVNTTGALRRSGTFERGNHSLIRVHEYCLLFVNSKEGKNE
jgi:hypothetical protein